MQRVRSTTQRRGNCSKPLCNVGSLDDLDHPRADFGQSLAEFVARIAAIGEDMAQPGEAVALPALDLLARVIAPWTATFCGFDALFLSLSKDGCR